MSKILCELNDINKFLYKPDKNNFLNLCSSIEHVLNDHLDNKLKQYVDIGNK